MHTGFVAGILPTMLLTGIGSGLLFMPSLSVAMSDVAPTEAGVASGLTNVAVQLGASIGVAALATISAAHTTHLLAQHESLKAALTGGYRVGFVVAAGFAAAALVTSVVLLRSHRPSTIAEVRVQEAVVVD